MTLAWSNKQNLSLLLGAVAGGVLLAYIYVFVVAYAALIISSGGYKYLGRWAFFLNGTASALLLALVAAVPLGAILPRLAMPVAWISGTVATVLFLYFGAESLLDARLWWVTVTDALQLGLIFLAGAWVGSRLRTLSSRRT
jgi:hypothetical protein